MFSKRKVQSLRFKKYVSNGYINKNYAVTVLYNKYTLVNTIYKMCSIYYRKNTHKGCIFLKSGKKDICE